MINKKILLVGGNGYIGNVITRHFLNKGAEVIVTDSNIYGQNELSLNYVYDKKYRFIPSQIRDLPNIKNIFNNLDCVVILGGLVGDPITKKFPKESLQINSLDISNLIKFISKKTKIKKTIFISTCSNYGLSDNFKLTEKSALNPLSSYAKSKVEIEKLLISLNRFKNFNYTILRFATAFGLSPRMRFDLTLNEFTKNIFYNEKLEVYDADTWRPYCHVKDFANAIELVIAKKLKTKNQIYNVGSDKNNYTKRDIIKIIEKYKKSKNIKYLSGSFDKRNYRVSFDKIKKLGFRAEYNVDKGVKEIIQAFKDDFFNFKKNENKYGNYKINL